MTKKTLLMSMGLIPAPPVLKALDNLWAVGQIWNAQMGSHRPLNKD